MLDRWGGVGLRKWGAGLAMWFVGGGMRIGVKIWGSKCVCGLGADE